MTSSSGTSRHHTTVVSLPEPFGRRRCLAFAESDGGWLGAAADGKTVTTYACISERLVNSALLAFNSAGIIGRLPRSVFAGGASAAPTSEQVAHWVAVRRGGALLAARTLRCRGDYRSAAAATVLLAGSLAARGAAAPTGVLVPEELVTIGELRPALAKAGIVVVDERPPVASADAPLVSTEQAG